jgi:hypothetical protein
VQKEIILVLLVLSLLEAVEEEEAQQLLPMEAMAVLAVEVWHIHQVILPEQETKVDIHHQRETMVL